MARVDADRNLLLGILAQQMDFVTRDALFEAMNAWIIRKDTPLGALLVERGDLAKSRRDLLEALVEEHVRAHGGDPARSLQALSSVGPVAEDLGKFSDPDVRASVGHLFIPETVAPSDDPSETRAPTSIGQPTSWNGRFRVVRPHAHGGLGIVSIALDDELDREVAFKEIKDRYADDRGSQARFVLEAEITGKLEHPGIIPIYGLGHDPDGRPFYAMRFIRGDSLADAINRYHDPNGAYTDPTKRTLQLRELLGRFLDVCDALAYAHSRGVLHRDLKPGNVMLGPFGETLVVDWGLALPLERVPEGHESTYEPVKSTKADSASLPREHGEVIGTPAYMSPEQAEGAIDKLGPRSDVYGLGAILYDLLTGKHPVNGTSLEEVLYHVGKGEIQPPRQVRPEIPASLEAVCLKALAFRPEDRYPTPRALAADLKAWLADEPVSARPEPFAERARRWAKRNRTAVTAAAASLLVGIIGLGAVAAILVLSNIALDKQRLRAEDREAQAIAAVKKFGDVIANEPELKQTPALEGLRKRLLNEPLAFFRALRERLQADRDTRPESLARLAEASFELGNLTNEIGNKQDAMIAYRESIAIGLKLADLSPNVPQFRSGLAAGYNSLGNSLSDAGNTVEAMRNHEVALAIRQKLADEKPKSNEFQRKLASSYNDIGMLHSSIGKQSEALRAYESSRAIQQNLVDAEPTNTKFELDLMGSLNNIAMLLWDTGKPSESLHACESAVAIGKKLNDTDPNNKDIMHALAVSYSNLGNLVSASGDLDAALKAYELAIAIQQKLVDANPTITEFMRGLAASHNAVGILFGATGQPDEAIKAHNLALAIRHALTVTNPKVIEFRRDLAASHNNIGCVLVETGRLEEASKSFNSALAIRLKLAREHPESTGFANDMGGTLNNLASIDLNANRFEEARIRLHQAVEWQQKSLAVNPANPTYRKYLDVSLSNLIKAARGLADPEGVAEAERELAKLRDSDPAMAALDARLAAILQGGSPPGDNPERLQLAQRAYERTLHAAAAKLWAEALDVDPKLAEDRQAGHRYNAACAASLAGCGRGKDDPPLDDPARAKLREQARAWLQAELATWAKLVESGPPDARAVIAQTLQHWKEDGDLAGVRAWEALPEPEREPWHQLWTGVDALLARAQAVPGPSVAK